MIFCLCVCLFVVFMVGVGLCIIWGTMKNENTYMNRMLIIKGIWMYNRSRVSNDEWISFDVMESYDDTFKRWWDWGCTRIVPPYAYKKIKPYLKGER